MDFLLSITEKINTCLSDYILTFVLAFSGIYFSFLTRFVQVRCFPAAIKAAFSGFTAENKNTSVGISSFQALMTTVGAQVGTGNIVGVCSALLTGGPGAVFWIWVMAFFGMATAYSEAVLARQTAFTGSDLTVHGGPVYYIKKAFPGTLGGALSRFFSFSVIISLGFIGCAVQSNAIVSTAENAFNLPPVLLAAVLCVSCAFVFRGGMSLTAKLSEKLVPLMAMLYITGCVFLLVCNVKRLPEAVFMIFYGAVKPHALIGGTFGYAIKTAVSQGAKRGLFSNEAGMGSTPHAHALAVCATEHEQGLMAMVSVFIDTFLVLSLTALVAVCCFFTGGTSLSGIDKNNMIQQAFSSLSGEAVGTGFVAICLFFFSFSSVISWNFFGKMNFLYLFGKGKAAAYLIISCAFIFMGGIFGDDLVWSLSDIFNQLMVIPNVAALLALSKDVRKTVDFHSSRGIMFSEKQ